MPGPYIGAWPVVNVATRRRDQSERTPRQLALQIAKRFFNLLAGIGGRNDQREAWRTAVVCVQIHGVLEARRTMD